MTVLAAAVEVFPLHTPFRISRGVRTEAQVVVTRVTRGGVTGRGEGVPYARYGESVDSVIAQIENIAGAVADGADRTALLGLMPAGAARNAVDCALWDLESRETGRSVAALSGVAMPERVASALTIVIDTPEAMAAAAARLAQVPLLKVKVDASDPAAMLRAVRAAAPEPRLIVDPNESWTRAIMADLRGLLVDMRCDLLEQPVPAGEDDWLAEFDAGVPVAADEAVHVAADIDRIAPLYDVVNVKLDKAGGLTAALELAKVTREAGLGLMTGCMVSTSLSIAPALLVAGMSDFADLDGPVWMAADRPGGVADVGGWMTPAAPGFWGAA